MINLNRNQTKKAISFRKLIFYKGIAFILYATKNLVSVTLFHGTIDIICYIQNIF
ncbi:hypothetical protein [Hathewaya limosa]|uniref:hypothetical protein n=1 Tax=Hathewaya limosa TaxID=1536 RepID=UPI0027D9210D|nr:hypothetical protein [Hathewaya limosa]